MKNADICMRLTSGAEPSVCVTPESARQELGDVLGLTGAFFVGGGEFRMRRTLAEATMGIVPSSKGPERDRQPRGEAWAWQH